MNISESIAKRQARASRRVENAVFNAEVGAVLGIKKPKKPKRKRLESISKLKKRAWDAFATFIKRRDAHKDMGRCLICHVRPIECAYHLLSKAKGNAIYFDEDAVVGACASCNYCEMRQRDEYVFRHMEIFGADRMWALRAKSKTILKLGRQDYLRMVDEYKAKADAIGPVPRPEGYP